MSTKTGQQSQQHGSEAMESLLQNVTTVADNMLFTAGMGNYTEHCSGIIILTASEAALGFSGQYGTCILLQHFKKTNTWSLPVAIRMAGAGFGVQFGAQTKSMVIFLNDHQLKTFADNAVLRMGTEIGFSLSNGLEGDAYLDISDWFHVDGSSAWTETKGWKLCISLQGNAVSPIGKLNKEMYGDLYDPRSSMSVTEKILAGKTQTKVTGQKNEAIRALHDSLNAAIEKKWIPKWYYDKDEVQQTSEIAETA